ncbi:MAG: WD40/YVTN/BNR-like repeat-containing protein, partial [Longimicrobiales bacterium]
MPGHARYVYLGAALLVSLQAESLRAQQATPIPVAEEFERLHFRSIGPATMSGRISDLAVYETNPAVYYVGTAHGGVWKTTSNGALFTPLFQDQALISIGDVTISQRNPDLLSVGAGESNNRQSTSWGGGVYKSTDGGRTFQPMGLRESRHINRIVIDPSNNDIVWVAATGPLFGPGGDRGVYKTTDGGGTWRHVLRVDAETGANDLVMSATDPRTMFASTYQRRRVACCMNGGGPGSGIWKSMDAGETWTRLSGGGLPSGPLGRIALDVYRKDGRIVYATIEGPGGGGRGGGGGGAEEGPGADTTAAGGGRGGRGGEGAAGGGLPPGVTGVYRSNDGGQTWQRVSGNNPRPMYFSQVVVDPTNADRMYMGGVGLQMTIDGGRTFATDAALVTHDDVHAIWVNPANPEHILIGNDGGLAVSYDMSKTWTFLPNLPAGLFYHVSYDMETPFNVCSGMQDNYNWCGPSASRMNRGIMNYDWFQIQGGDGFHAIPDPRDSRIIYTESQNGNMIRRNKVTGESKNIRPTAANVTPAPAQGAANYRWNWDTPIVLSPHDPGVMFVAANRVFRSTDRGDSWTVISPEMTMNANRNEIVTMGVRNDSIRIARNDGVNWPTIVSLAESPRQAGLLYVGTDDGVVSVSRDGGANWQNVTRNMPGFPAGGYVSEVVPSRFDAGTVYVTVDNHLNNDYGSYIWASTDFGATFRSIVGNLSGENVRTLTEDQKNPDVLYIGTETGIFLALDRGRSWRRLKANLPTVRIDEITLHPRDNAMIVATHGRALWILDHLEPIQEFAAAQAATGAKLFTIPTALQWKAKDDRNDEFWGHQFFAGENPPVDAVIQYHLRAAANSVDLRITDARGATVRELAAPENRRQPGIQTVCWDLRIAPIPAPQQPAVAPPAGEGGRG